MKRKHRHPDEQKMDALRRLARLQTVADVLSDVHETEREPDTEEAARRLARLQAIADMYRRAK